MSWTKIENEEFVKQFLSTDSKKEKKEKIEVKVNSTVLDDRDMFAKRMLKVLAKELGDGKLAQNRVELNHGNSSTVLFALKTLEKMGEIEYWKLNKFIMVMGKNTGLKLVYEFLDNRQAKNISELSKRKI